jgi:hypothetical protein
MIQYPNILQPQIALTHGVITVRHQVLSLVFSEKKFIGITEGKTTPPAAGAIGG